MLNLDLQYLSRYDIISRMAKKHSKPRKNHLTLTKHARQRLSERGLWPALGHIARIAHHPASPRFTDWSNAGRPVERIEVDGVCIIVARHQRNLTLLTIHSGDERGARACLRIAAISQKLGQLV
jgi:hypothetical protein